MTRDEAIRLRCRQLAGEAVSADELAEALAVIASPEPQKRRGRKPGPFKPKEAKAPNPAHRRRDDPPGLLGIKARANRVLIANLVAKQGLQP